MIIKKKLFLLAICGFLTSSLYASKNSAKEADLKAAYIYNFMRYTKWNKEKKDKTEFVICVYNESALYNSLKKLEKKTLKNIKIKVITVGTEESCLIPCDVVILSQMEDGLLNSFVRKATIHHVLSISDTDGYAQKGVMINLKRVANKMTFEVNLTKVKKSQLHLSSNLLKMASIVRP